MAANPELLILAVDDKHANLVALERSLAGVAARIITAVSAEEALAATLQHDFALAILDVQMPGMDGYELAEMLMSDGATARIPIIFVTAAHSDEQHLFRGYASGAVDYIVKPYDPVVLVAKVKVFLELARYRFGLEGVVAERTRALEESEHRHRTLFDTMAQGVVYHGADGRIVEANPAASRILGMSVAQLRGRHLSDECWRVRGMDGTPLAADAHPTSAALRTGQPVRDVHVHIQQPWSERELVLSIDATPECRPGELAPYRVYTAFSDITERVASQTTMANSLREKETLLKEIHHRVKNNLQIISSLVMLQVDSVASDEARSQLLETGERVRTMALIHQQLYGASSFERINLADYARDLTQSLQSTFAPTARVQVGAEAIEANLELAMPLGLILNELITNSLKYGRTPNSDESTPNPADFDVRVDLRQDGPDLHLSVADSGPGFPVGMDLDKTTTLGLTVVRRLCRQIRAKLTMHNDGGARCTIVCPMKTA